MCLTFRLTWDVHIRWKIYIFAPSYTHCNIHMIIHKIVDINFNSKRSAPITYHTSQLFHAMHIFAIRNTSYNVSQAMMYKHNMKMNERELGYIHPNASNNNYPCGIITDLATPG